MGADSRPCCHIVIYGGNYTSALLHEHTAHFSGISSYMDEEKLGFREKKKNLVFKATPGHRKPTVCSYKKTPPQTHNHTQNPPPFSC